MKRIAVVLILSAVMVTSAMARHHVWVGGAGMGPFGSAIAGKSSSGGGGAACSNKLDFTQTCNIIYFYNMGL